MKTRLIATVGALALLAGGVVAASPAAAASTNGTVKGIVRSTDGVPIVGAQVIVNRLGESAVTKIDVTSKNGRYDMALKPGSYQLIVVDPQNDYASSTNPKTFTIETGVTDRVKKRLQPGGTIRGKVRSDAGKLLKNVTVTATGVNRSGAPLPVETKKTDDTGTFSFRGLTSGTYKITYAKDGYLSAERAAVDVAFGEKRSGRSAAITKPGKIKGSAFVNGAVVDKDLGEVIATLTKTVSGEVVATQSLDPKFTFLDLLPGDYTLTFCGGENAPFITCSQYPSTIVVNPGESKTGLSYAITTPADAVVPVKTTVTSAPAEVTAGVDSVTVGVSTSSYSPTAGATVSLSYDDAVQQTGTLDASGAASFTVPTGFWIGKPGAQSVSIAIDATDNTAASTATASFTVR